mgnify:CR=1 FL=1|tara:strand:- start:171 stop:320 length:150 start_codon:yes stop_codon:yes gene_type:complete
MAYTKGKSRTKMKNKDDKKKQKLKNGGVVGMNMQKKGYARGGRIGSKMK